MATEPHIKAAEVAQRLGFPKSYITELARRRAIPVVKFSKRCHRFRFSEVEAALAKLNVKAVG